MAAVHRRLQDPRTARILGESENLNAWWKERVAE